MYCYICDANGDESNRDVVAVCCERDLPVCAKHARGCVEDGHGTRPLEEIVGPRPYLAYVADAVTPWVVW